MNPLHILEMDNETAVRVLEFQRYQFEQQHYAAVKAQNDAEIKVREAKETLAAIDRALSALRERMKP